MIQVIFNPLKQKVKIVENFSACNQAISESSLCKISGSAVSSDTRTDVIAYKKLYPVPLKMHSVEWEQKIKEVYAYFS